MSVSFACPSCYTLNAPKNAHCSRCGAKLPKDGRGRPFTSTFRHNGKKVITALGYVTLSEARRIEAEIKFGLRGDGHKVIEVGERPTVAWWELVDKYLRKLEAEGRSKQYQRDSRLYLRRMSDHWGSDRPIGSITAEMIEEFRLVLQVERRVSKTSCDRHLAAGKAAWRYGAPRYLKDPFSEVRLYRKDRQVTRFLTESQRERLLTACREISEDLYQVVFIALATGLRKGNILNLKRSEVDFERGVITVTQKGDRLHPVVMSPGVQRLLQSIPDRGEYFWLSPRTGEPYDISWRTSFKQALERAGISDFRWHDLRHDCATSILRATGNLRTVQSVLGHSNIQTTTRYAHVVDEALREAMNAVDPSVGKPSSAVSSDDENS